MAVQVLIQFNGKQLTIPINPEEINISRDADNEDLDIIGLGKTVRKGEPSLITTSIESFFPAEGTQFYTGVKPKTCVDFIEEIWHAENTNNNVAKIVTTGLPINLDMYFVIDSFEYDHRAAEEEDIYYTLEIKQYKAYGVKTVNVDLSGLAAARASSPKQPASASTENKPQTKTYTVVKGDCLWNITKKYTGNGAGWRALYNLNKGVVGKNPNLIYPRSSINITSGVVENEY